MTDYKINFRELKSKVGIDDVAYDLGYKLNKKAGVGRYIELVLGDSDDRNIRDTIIISNPNKKEAQTFFRRDGSKGDVVSLIRENLNSFNVSGKDEWHRVAKVLAKFANEPEPEYHEDREYVRAAKVNAVFDSSRYEVKPMDTEKLPSLFAQRGLSAETVQALAPFISLIRDKQNGKFEGFNIGFPYTQGDDTTVKGYEIRGYGGYKSKAAGSNSNSAAWVADLSRGNHDAVKQVFFCESAFDAMAFYQLNRLQLSTDIALVSLGGTFSDGQITNVMQRFPQAKAYDCFDNDLAGRIYGLRMLALLEGIPMKINKTEEVIQVEAKGKAFSLSQDRSLTAQLSEHLHIRYRMGQRLPPKAFKDWNDCLLNKPVEVIMTPRKEEREQKLAERRNAGLKI